MHIKLFITLSDKNDSDNAVVFGGRNIHDGFLFREKPDHSEYPELVQYGIDDDFVHWNDFEAKITSKEIATLTAAHLQRFLDRDRNTQQMLPFTVNDDSVDSTLQNSVRHFISIPYVDGHALEKLYVDMIDSAQISIKISSPYLRPTRKIADALKRAAKRQIKITVQTRVDLTGDTQAWLYEEVNKESINSFYADTKIYKWVGNSILHSKFVLIDGKIALIGSSNLSRRSFIHDVENGFLIQDENVVKQMDTILSSYIDKSEPITGRLPRKFWPSIMIYLLENQF